MMKKLALIATLSLAAVAAAQTADAPSTLTGKWKIHATIAGNESDSSCDFTQTGADLSGSCTAGEQPATKISGKVDVNKVTWTMNSEYNGTPLTMKYSGTLTDGKISGTLTVDPFGVDGDFSAIPAK